MDTVRSLILALLAVAGSACAGATRAGETPTRTDLTPAELARVRAVTKTTTDFSRAEAHEALSGGTGTVAADDLDAFFRPEQNLDDAGKQNFTLGKALFGKLWVPAPSSTQASDGLGPLFNARSCESCHLHGGRGHPPDDGANASFFFRLARSAQTEAERKKIASHQVLNIPDPAYGGQFQDQAAAGLKGEGTVSVTYTARKVTLAGGEVVELRVPHYAVKGLNYGPLDSATTLSPRIAQSILGMGLLENIPAADILAHADPDDRDGNGIFGKPNYALDAHSGKVELGRFGWKAQNPSVRDQAASALSGDIGISSPDMPNAYGDCTEAEKACLARPTGVQARFGTTEAPDPVLDLLAYFTAHVAVPQRRDVSDRQVLAGKALFYRIGCTACHTPKFVSRKDASDEAHSFQLIWPYSDLLLHDMGEGLADGQRVGDANGREWRTAPLWGIGLTKTVNGREVYLHDGRARTLQEAILWHGGEAMAARNAFTGLEKQDRRKLLKFLESL